ASRSLDCGAPLGGVLGADELDDVLGLRRSGADRRRRAERGRGERDGGEDHEALTAASCRGAPSALGEQPLISSGLTGFSAGGRAISHPCETSCFASPPRDGFARAAFSV